MKVFSASLFTETNTFGPLPTGLNSFKERVYYPAKTHPEHMTHASGPLWAARIRGVQNGWQLVEGLVAAAQPSGIVSRQAYETLRDELLADLKDAIPVDMVLLGLHGAMVADGYEDCEGDLLRRVREIVGDKVTVGATLDPHSALTEDMIEYSDVLIAYKEYPHTDVLDRALELVDICSAKVEGRCSPVASLVDCNMIINAIHTTQGPAMSLVNHIKELESADSKTLTISLIHGFPWGDVPGMGTKVLVYADNDKEHAATLASRLAKRIIEQRHELGSHCLDLDGALDEVVGCASGPVVLADTADNTGGGAAGDSTFVVRRILERGIKDAVIGPIWDPGAVRIAFEAGEGARLYLRIGGKVGPGSGEPLDLLVTIVGLRADMLMSGVSPNTFSEMGDAAFVEVDGVSMVLVSRRNQAMSVDLFTQFGCDLSAKKLIVVKSSQHFYASFSKIAAKVVYADSPGALASDINRLAYKKINRPKWPLDAFDVVGASLGWIVR